VHAVLRGYGTTVVGGLAAVVVKVIVIIASNRVCSSGTNNLLVGVAIKGETIQACQSEYIMTSWAF
jgi:hypothetical protein